MKGPLRQGAQCRVLHPHSIAMPPITIVVVSAQDTDEEVMRMPDATTETTIWDVMHHLKQLTGLRCSQQRYLLPGSERILNASLPVDAIVQDDAKVLTLCVVRLSVASCQVCEQTSNPHIKIQFCTISYQYTFCSRPCWLQHVRRCHTVPLPSDGQN